MEVLKLQRKSGGGRLKSAFDGGLSRQKFNYVVNGCNKMSNDKLKDYYKKFYGTKQGLYIFIVINSSITLKIGSYMQDALAETIYHHDLSNTLKNPFEACIAKQKKVSEIQKKQIKKLK